MADRQIPTEPRRARFFRVFYQAVLLLAGLWYIDRNGSILALHHTLLYWIGLLVVLISIVFWQDFTRTERGRRLLASPWLERFTLAWASLLIALGLMEAFLRSDISQRYVFGQWPPESISLYVSLPGITYDLNSQGFRDVEHEVRKPAGMTRVVLLGDSLTFGQGVAQQDTYPARLRALSGESWEWIVLAKGGASTQTELGFLKEYGCAYKPDIVIASLVTNDPHVASGPPPPQDWPILTRRAGNADSYNPHFAYLIDYHLNRLLDGLDMRYSYLDWEADLYDAEQPWFAEWQSAVQEMSETARACGAERLYAVTLPSAANYQDPDLRASIERKHAILTGEFEAAGFETVDLLPAYLTEFGERPFHSLWALPNDGHPNAEVHTWYAEQIWALLGSDVSAQD